MRINDPKRMKQLMQAYKVNEMFGQDMLPYLSLHQFKRNEFICREEEELGELYIFLYGKAKIMSNLSSGKSLLLDYYDETMLMGELELLTNQNASTSVQAIGDCYCLSIPMDVARKKLLGDAVFLLHAGRSLAFKLERTAKNSSINLLYPLQNRLASYMLVTGKRVDRGNSSELVFKSNLSETADLLGTSYRHLLRTLEDFRDDGILKKEGRTYIAEDIAMLERIAGDLYRG